MMKSTRYILLAATMMAAGCESYIGGLDDSNIRESQIVMVNRSSHSIEVSVNQSDLISPEGTIFLGPQNGLWKFTMEGEHHNFHFNNDIMTLIFDGERKISIDGTTFGMTQSVNLHDSKGVYNVYDFSDTFCDRLFRKHDYLKVFQMNNLPPSFIDTDSVKVRGSSEGWFQNIYPVSGVREKLKIGRIVQKEAGSLDKIVFEEGLGEVPCNVTSSDKVSIQSRGAASYYSIETLRKIGLVHFGCDFAALTGRGSSDMEKFAGTIIYRICRHYAEGMDNTEDTDAFINDMPEGTAAIWQISYGSIMFLLAEADCNPDYMKHSLEKAVNNNDPDTELWVDDIDFHLISLNEAGEFQCQSGGREMLDRFINGSIDQPIFPYSFSVTDFGSGIDAIHIPDIQ